jgi:tetratricopeptide (TPR) repeat protein
MKRDRNHVLEDLSVTALRRALPELWVMHDFRRDYGIDVQIEIFDADGNTTGLRVYGQLKATDKSEDDDVLSLDREHFEYWSSHSDPVLLLRYFAKTKALKWCWMHDVEWRMKATAASVDVAPHLEPWHQDETAKNVEQLVRLRKEVIQHQLSLPTTISVRDASNGVLGSLKLAEGLAARLPSSSFKVLGEAASPCHFDVLFEKDKLRLSHVGLPGFVITCEADCSGIDAITDLTVLLLFLISCRYDRSSVARVIAVQCPASLFRAATSEKFQRPLIDGLIYALGIDQAIPLILSKLIDKEDPIVWLNIHTVGLRASKRYGQLDLWQQQLKAWADSPPHPGMAASSAYNVANSLANTGSWDEALTYYRIAGERDPDYLARDYYWAELGAAQFETDQFSAAADSYQKAFDINHSPTEQWRLGDALFQCGRYEEAYGNICGAVAEDTSLGSYPHLVAVACEELMSRWGIKEQKVEPVSAETQEALMALKAAVSEDDTILKLRPFLEVCAIDPLLSFNAGHLANISDQPEIAMYRFLTCALRQRGDVQAWACAITSAIKCHKNSALPYLIEVAYFYVGEGLLEAVLKSFPLADSMPSEKASRFQQQLIGLIRSTEKAGKDPVTLRIHGASETKTFNADS